MEKETIPGTLKNIGTNVLELIWGIQTTEYIFEQTEVEGGYKVKAAMQETPLDTDKGSKFERN